MNNDELMNLPDNMREAANMLEKVFMLKPVSLQNRGTLELHNNLRDARKMRNLTAQQLSDLTGNAVSDTHIQSVERGRTDITVSKALVLAIALGMPVNQLFYLKEVR